MKKVLHAIKDILNWILSWTPFVDINDALKWAFAWILGLAVIVGPIGLMIHLGSLADRKKEGSSLVVAEKFWQKDRAAVEFLISSDNKKFSTVEDRSFLPPFIIVEKRLSNGSYNRYSDDPTDIWRVSSKALGGVGSDFGALPDFFRVTANSANPTYIIYQIESKDWQTGNYAASSRSESRHSVRFVNPRSKTVGSWTELGSDSRSGSLRVGGNDIEKNFIKFVNRINTRQ